MTTRMDWCKFMIRKFDHGRSKLFKTLITGDETWIYQYDPETKQQSSVWLFPDDNPPQKLRRARSGNKQMVASFISKKGHVATIPLLEQKTVTASWYVNICMPQVIEKWSILHPKAYLTSLQWHHDNASAHEAALTMDFLQKMLACAKHVLGSAAAEKLDKIPLSNDTVKRRINEISQNLEDKLVRLIKGTPISIQLDESTFGAESTLIVCMRFIDNDCIKEELLFVDYFECRCTGQDIFKMVRSYFDSHQISLSQVVSVSTDGARNMTGRDNGFGDV
ncbi:Transposase [Oopsacas minuta]|uniref:Transposase n=1 Tax=Oopsacas minuta TaxID=111878 RepID=A0AAV7JJD7_9METZ|nr:Transposase [Oopsacas minuta]